MKSSIKKGCGCLLGAILLLCIAGAISLYVSRPKWKDEYGQRFTDVVYGSREHNTYDLYLPNGAAQKDSLGLILYVHGGSWLGGDKKDHHGDCYAWVQKGYATASMNYSLLNEGGVSLPTMIEEIDSCIHHIIKFAEERGAHINQMAIAGNSAGGHLSMMYAYNHSHPIPLRFEVIKVGPADLRVLFPYDKGVRDEDVEKFVFACTGEHVPAAGYSEAWLDSIKLLASPVNYINGENALPAIFAYGQKDKLVRRGHYEALQEAYDSVGGTYRLIVFPNSGHLLMGDKECTERLDSTMMAYCKKYFGY